MSANQASEPKERTLKFKAEVKQLLDIVINSLYTDRDIFVRELISNASDALEKLRHQMLTEDNITDKDTPLEIRIDLDEETGSFAITDSGIGMTIDEASQNLGTIAHSGSKEFLKKVEETGEVDAHLIGQFGVGFYSAFMVAERVTVQSQSCDTSQSGVIWKSSGSGNFKVKTADGLKRGTRIIIPLKEDAKEFAKADRVKELIHQYSNFVPFPIFVNGEQVNTVQPVWTKNKNELSEEDYKGFYQFVANAHDEPIYTFHFNADAPLAIRSILFVPGSNYEKLGFGKLDPGVGLYCKKVLIEAEAKELLPDYMRFLKGVVDSEDLPLNISRETMQDSALIAKIRRVLTKRMIKFLVGEAGNDGEKYNNFFKEFSNFIKEGASSDFENREELAKLLRFASSEVENDKLTSLEEYVSRMKDEQKSIYYISGLSRTSIEAGPYIEAFRDRGIEVLYLYDPADDFVMSSLREFEGKVLKSADQADLDLPELEKKEEDKNEEETTAKLDDKNAGNLARWIKEVLGDKVDQVKPSKRLTKSPAVLVNPDEMMTTGMQRVMQAMAKSDMPMGKMILEINPNHQILKNLNNLRLSKTHSEFASEAANLLYENASVTAGLMADPRTLVERSTHILNKALEGMAGDINPEDYSEPEPIVEDDEVIDVKDELDKADE